MTPASIKAAYVRALSLFETVQFRRYSGTGSTRTAIDYPVRARVTFYTNQPDELTGGIVQNDRRIIALADDVTKSGFGLPFVATGDKVVVRGRELTIKSVDDNTRRVGGELMAFDIRAGG